MAMITNLKVRPITVGRKYDLVRHLPTLIYLPRLTPNRLNF